MQRILRAGVVAALVGASFYGVSTSASASVPWATAFTSAGCTVWTMPGAEGSVSVEAVGAAGSAGVAADGGTANGGAGDAVSADLVNIAQGASLDVCVDVGGGPSGGDVSGAGGGASGVSLGSDFSQPVVIAGGGGGGATNANGGAAGTPVAAKGDDSPLAVQPGGGGYGGSNTAGSGGQGGQGGSGFNGACGTAGGSGGATDMSGPGSGGAGGPGTNCGPTYRSGGGGGGGYYAGGGGGSGLNGGAGGGGTDYCADGAGVEHCALDSGAGTQPAAGSGAGDAEVLIRYVADMSTNLVDAATDTTWSGTETYGAAAVGTARIAEIAGAPTGDVTFSFYAGTSCAGTAVVTSTGTLADQGGGVVEADSASTGPLPAGDYSWQARYPGDTTYGPATSACSSFSVAGPSLRPKITSIEPASGSVTGGTAITVTGSGFTIDDTVLIGQGDGVRSGAIEATDVQVVSTTTITAVTGGGAKHGTYHTYVVTPRGRSRPTGADYFTYQPVPQVDSVSPASGPASGGTPITIDGSGFGAGPATVLIGQGKGVRGAVQATDVDVVSDGEITAMTPASPKRGTFHVFVSTPDGDTSLPSPAQFTYTR